MIATTAAGGEQEQYDASDSDRQAAAAEAAARECELYCALCTKRHALLRELFVVFGRATAAGRAAVLKNAEGLARVLGGAAPALLALIDDTPAGAETLLLRMLYFLTESHPPPQVSRWALYYRSCRGIAQSQRMEFLAGHVCIAGTCRGVSAAL